ncbi:exodeoxyribonuclease V subunit gamma [Lampropedia puyangensis]|nr:exodeoxyribonuclease V subunit gamma [Lampropedia puyangensis]
MLQTSSIAPGLLALHSNRTEKLAQALAHWTQQHPLQVLEQEVFLVQSNGMAEWLKMVLAQELGISASIQVELPGRFAWRMYRQILGADQVPFQTPLDKQEMLWQLMRLLPEIFASDSHTLPVWQPLLHIVGSSNVVAQQNGQRSESTYQLALRIADLLDQYQVYRPDWLQDWAQGHDVLARFSPHQLSQPNQGEHQPLPAEALWQPTLWRLLLASQSPAQASAIRPQLHLRALQALQQGQPVAALPRRVCLFGMSHVALPILELLSHMAHHSQVLLAIPNPCQEYWSDALDGRELFARMRKQQHRQAQQGRKNHAETIANTPLHSMHAHANPLLSMWGRQVRDFIRLLEHYEEHVATHAELRRVDFFDVQTPQPNLLQQVQQHIRELTPLSEPISTHIPSEDRSICFQCTHSPVREVEALHDHLLDLMRPSQTTEAPHASPPVTPREVVVMVPDIHQYAPLIEAIFGQYGPQDSRHIPFDIADLDAQSSSTLVQAMDWLAHLPEQRASLAQLADLLRVPSVAARIGLDEDGVAQLHAWMQGSGIRWGVDAAHREQLGIHAMGAQNTAWFGLQRMLLAFASDAPWNETEPYEEVGGLAAAYVGALAYLVGQLQHWQDTLSQPATPIEWAARWRAMLAAFFKPVDDADQAALKLLDAALQHWLDATEQANYAATVPLSVARHAWLSNLQAPQSQQRFHAGGVTFCTLLPMRAIPFRIVCLLGMNEGVYPRRATPNEMDLMRLPGLLRAGDRSRAQDDRQLMLEALLSAREQLLISWVGRSVRDNTERPPSLLVAQLRDYLSQRWNPALVEERTTEHPLQPFNIRYFTEPTATSPLHTWAEEWRPKPAGSTLAATQDNPPTTARQTDDTPRIWTVSELAEVWRNPVQKWFTTRLQTRFNPLPEMLDDREPLVIDGLQRWQIFEGLTDTLAPHMQPEASAEHLHNITSSYFKRLQRSGNLPLGGLAQQWQTQWQEECAFLLKEWQSTLQAWPQLLAQRTPLQWPHTSAPLVEDWASPMRYMPSADRVTQVIASGIYFNVHPHNILQKARGPLKVRSLLVPWLQAVLLSAHDVGNASSHHSAPAHAHLQPTRIVALDAVVDIVPLPPALAQQWLTDIVALANQAITQPLPFDFTTALSWWNTMASSTEANGQTVLADDEETSFKALQAARQTYDGGHFAGQAQRNPYMSRLWPAFDEVLASGQFEALATHMLTPLHEWIANYLEVRYPDAQE